MSEWTSVWQTWAFVHPTRETPLETVACGTQRTQTLREDVQTARIQQRMTVFDLAQKTGIDAEVLGAYERGKTVLDARAQTTLKRVLDLR